MINKEQNHVSHGGGGDRLTAPLCHPECVNTKGSSLYNKQKAGLLRLKLNLPHPSYRHLLPPMGRRKKCAFTLAEVLVTLGIIGVVSAMTVPSLMNHYQRQTYVTQLHKVYNEASQAAMQYVTDKNAIDLQEAGLTSQAAINEWVKNYFKIVQNCGNSGEGCFAIGEYKKMNGSAINIFVANEYNYYVLANGAAISVSAGANGNIYFYVDVNAKKGPNIVGRDTFAMLIYNNGMIDDSDSAVSLTAPLTKEQREASYTSYCTQTSGTWWGCFGKILNDGWQMTY